MNINYIDTARWLDQNHTSLYVRGLFDTSSFLSDLTLNKDEEEQKEDFDNIVNNYNSLIEEYEEPKKFIIPTKEEELINKVEKYIKQTLNQIAQRKGYDLGVTLATYYYSTIPQFKNEASKYINYRDELWNAWFDVLNNLSNTKTIPTFEEVIKELPTFECW